MNHFIFNLNEGIKVKLYDKGYQVLADGHNSYIGIIPNWEFRTADYYKEKADENGYTIFQGWDFFNKFSKTMRLGEHGHFNLDILIEHAKEITSTD